MRELRKSVPLATKDTASLVHLLGQWKIPVGREQAVHDMALASLEQVRGSSDYEDARALLMIVAFLTALAGAVFNRFSSAYSLPRWHEIVRDWDYAWPALAYAMFGAYAVIVSGSAFVIFGAMKPTDYECDRDVSRRDGNTLSFQARLLDTHPRMWGQNFIELTGNGECGSDNLTAQYAKYYILETYLAAQKVAQRLKKAAPAVRWLQMSMLFLAGFIVSYGATMVFLQPQLK